MMKTHNREDTVLEFHSKFNHPIDEPWTVKLLEFRLKLIREESGEVMEEFCNMLIDLERGKNVSLQQKNNLLEEAEQSIKPLHERLERLKVADKEITSRLKQSRAIIEGITDKSCSHAADIELLTEEDFLSSQRYQKDRKEIKAKLKNLAVIKKYAALR